MMQGHETLVVYNVRTIIQRRRPDNQPYGSYSPVNTAEKQPRSSTPKPAKMYRSAGLGLGLNSGYASPKATSGKQGRVSMGEATSNMTAATQQDQPIFTSPVAVLQQNCPVTPKGTANIINASPESLSDADETDPNESPYAKLMRVRQESALKTNATKALVTNTVKAEEDEDEECDENAAPSNQEKGSRGTLIRKKEEPSVLTAKTLFPQPTSTRSTPASTTAAAKVLPQSIVPLPKTTSFEGNPFEQLVNTAATSPRTLTRIVPVSAPTPKPNTVIINDFDDDEEIYFRVIGDSPAPVTPIVENKMRLQMPSEYTPTTPMLKTPVRKDSIPEPISATKDLVLPIKRVSQLNKSKKLPDIDENVDEMTFPNDEVDDIPSPRVNPMNPTLVQSTRSTMEAAPEEWTEIPLEYNTRRQSASSSTSNNKKGIFQEFSDKTRKRFASFGVGGQRKGSYMKPTPQQQQQSLIKHIKAGEVDFAKELLKDTGCEKIDPTEASKLLLYCVENVDNLLQPNETITLLIDDLLADVNAVDETGRTPLSTLFADPIIGRLLISRGADVLAEDQAGSCALSIGFEYGIEWMFDCWVSRGGEKKLREGDDALKVNKYVACLILGGYSGRAKEWIDEGLAAITADEATQLFAICQGMHSYPTCILIFSLVYSKLTWVFV